ncbi:MAG TPA: hypothetical protein VGW75_12065 [Solirubrobacteraceae bacterium]|nr:hypothetical protein [Solirubrobacteraceae bacterium]
MTGRIVAFLREIGLDVEPADLGDDTFLPGLAVEHGALRYDEARLTYPGDLLHEAAHLAVAPPDARARMTGDVAVPGLDLARLEVAAVPWSYAAALHLGIDPAVVFHAGGYRGKSAGLLRTFAAGVYPGVNLLVEAGMTTAEAYPRMLRWLRG